MNDGQQAVFFIFISLALVVFFYLFMNRVKPESNTKSKYLNGVPPRSDIVGKPRPDDQYVFVLEDDQTIKIAYRDHTIDIDPSDVIFLSKEMKRLEDTRKVVPLNLVLTKEKKMKYLIMLFLTVSLSGCLHDEVIETLKPIAWEVAKAKIKTKYPVAATAIQLLGKTDENFVVKYPITEDGIKQYVVAIVCKRTLDILSEEIVK